MSAFRQAKMNQCDASALFVEPLLNRKRLEAQPWVKQQTGHVVVETGGRQLAGFVLAERKFLHAADHVTTDALGSGIGRDDDIAHRAASAKIEAGKVREPYYLTVELDDGVVGALLNGIGELGRRQREHRLGKHVKQLIDGLGHLANGGNVFFFQGAMQKHEGNLSKKVEGSQTIGQARN